LERVGLEECAGSLAFVPLKCQLRSMSTAGTLKEGTSAADE